jgi:hypothetical protein
VGDIYIKIFHFQNNGIFFQLIPSFYFSVACYMFYYTNFFTTYFSTLFLQYHILQPIFPTRFYNIISYNLFFLQYHILQPIFPTLFLQPIFPHCFYNTISYNLFFHIVFTISHFTLLLSYVELKQQMFSTNKNVVFFF